MKQLRSTLILLLIAIIFGGYLYFRERGPAAEVGNTVLLRTDPAAVSQVKISQPNSQLTLIKSGENWRVKNKTEAVPADPDTVKSLLDHLQLVQSGSIVTKPGKLSEYGLEDSKNSISVGDASLTFGDAPSFDNSKVYVQVKNGGKKTIALLPTSLRDDALKTFANWRDKAVLRFDDEKVSQVQITAPQVDATFASEKADDTTKWNVTKPVSAKADSTTVENFLASLKNAQITNFLDDAPQDLNKWGLKKPQATVRISTAQGTKTLKIGKSVSGGNAAQNAASNTIFVLPSETYSLINRSLREWRNKDFLALDTAKVTQMKIAARGKTITLHLSGSDWTASNSKLEKTVVSNTASDFLVGMQALRADDFIDAPKADATYGFNKPALQVDIKSSQWQGTKTLQLATHGGKNYARLTGAAATSKTIYVMPSQVFDAFTKGLDRVFGKGK